MTHESLDAALESEPRPISQERFAELVHVNSPNQYDQRMRAATDQWIEANAPSILERLNA